MRIKAESRQAPFRAKDIMGGSNMKQEERLYNCPECAATLNVVCMKSTRTYAGKTLRVCPVAIGEQVSGGNGIHAFPQGSRHRKLIYYEEVGGVDGIREYGSKSDLHYGRVRRAR